MVEILCLTATRNKSLLFLKERQMYGNPHRNVPFFIYMTRAPDPSVQLKNSKIRHISSYISVSQFVTPPPRVFFSPRLIQRSSFNKRQNPLGLYHPHPLFPAFSQKKKDSPSKLPFCASVVSRWAPLRSRHVTQSSWHFSCSRDTSLTVACRY